MREALVDGLHRVALANGIRIDRYWFAEVWTPSGEVKRYQVIQPAVVGGFRR